LEKGQNMKVVDLLFLSNFCIWSFSSSLEILGEKEARRGCTMVMQPCNILFSLSPPSLYASPEYRRPCSPPSSAVTRTCLRVTDQAGGVAPGVTVRIALTDPPDTILLVSTSLLIAGAVAKFTKFIPT
jgi:hypothetical protein